MYSHFQEAWIEISLPEGRQLRKRQVASQLKQAGAHLKQIAGTGLAQGPLQSSSVTSPISIV